MQRHYYVMLSHVFLTMSITGDIFPSSIDGDDLIEQPELSDIGGLVVGVLPVEWCSCDEEEGLG